MKVDIDVEIKRSLIDPHSWVAIPHEFGDQSFALNSGRLTRVMKWAAREFAHGYVVTWVQVDKDTYRMDAHDEGS